MPVPEPVERRVEVAKEHILENVPDSVHRTLNTAHKPPVQTNSSHGDSSWFSDWKWRHPFSSSTTLDDNRAVLPPLKRRPFVYTYYEPKKGIERAILDAESKLLLTWRRAWWAQGFKPIVLGRAEAMNNPLYHKLKLIKTDLTDLDNEDGTTGLDSSAEYEVLRWLAWANMGTGIMMNWLALPMAPPDDELLKFLRRGVFPTVLHFESFGNNLFCGEKESINKLLSNVINKPELLTIAKSVIKAAHKDHFEVDKSDSGIALYSLATIRKLYEPIADLLQSVPEEGEGLKQLAELMNAHLHTVWQNTFPAGLTVLKPLHHMTTLVEPAMEIAKSLQRCSPAPIPQTCPPNAPTCKPCEESELLIKTLPVYRNTTDAFVIGSVPHPYTTTTLDRWKKTIDIRYIRRESKRDIWLAALTREVHGPTIGSSRRIVTFKDLVAGDYGSSHSLWLTAELESQKDLNWFFGFNLPPVKKSIVTPELNELNTTSLEVPGDSIVGSVKPPTPGEPTEGNLAQEREMLLWARSTLKDKTKRLKHIREAVEAWNLADTEAWKFAKAYSARRKVERLNWEQKEHKFAGAENGRARWFF